MAFDRSRARGLGAGLVGLVLATSSASADAGWLARYDDGTAATHSKRVTALVEGADAVTGAPFWLVAVALDDGMAATESLLMRIDEDQAVAWQHVYQAVIDDLKETATLGTFVAVGATKDAATHPFRPLAFTIDEAGSLGWSSVYLHTPDPTTFPGADFDMLHAVLVDGANYIVVGRKSYLQGDGFVADLWAMKLDATGNVLWQRTAGYDGMFNLEPIGQEFALDVATSANGYMVLGLTNAAVSTNGEDDILLVELSSNGDLLSERAVGTLADDVGRALTRVGDTHMIVARTRGGPDTQFADYLVMQLDGGLAPTWQTFVGMGGDDVPFDVVATGTHLFTIGGRGQGPGSAALLSKFTLAGGHVASWTLDGPSGGFLHRAILHDDELVLAGLTSDVGFPSGEVQLALLDDTAGTGASCAAIGTISPALTDASATTFARNTSMAIDGRFLVSTVSAVSHTLVEQAAAFAVDPVCGAPQLSLSPASIAFSQTKVGMDHMATAMLESTGAADLDVSAMTVTDPTHFGITGGTCGAAPFTLAAGVSCTVEVTFAPTAVGTHSADLEVTSNDALAPVHVVALGGEAVIGARELSVSPQSMAFGTAPEAMALMLSSTGEETVTVDGAAVASIDFSVGEGTCGAVPFSLAPGESCTLDVSFDPKGDAPYADTLTISSDDDVAPTQTVALTGEEMVVEMPVPGELVFLPGDYAFEQAGVMPLTAAPVQRFELRNDSEAPATLLSMTSSDEAVFFLAKNSGCLQAVSEGAGVVIKPGQACLFSVAYVADREGSHAGQIVAESENLVVPLELSGLTTSAPVPTEPSGCDLVGSNTSRNWSARWATWLLLGMVGIWRRRAVRQGSVAHG